jgi:glycosyltransferase involved in cell wall biosynthesis
VRVLVVSQYFPPEPGATQNRLGSFVDGLVERGADVTVVCEQPNHPAGVFHPGFGRRPLMTERNGRRVVRRLWVATAPHKTTARRLAFYGTFAAGAGGLVAAAARHDVVFVSTPPLPGALAAAAAARIRRTPLVVDVRDIWPAAAEALGELSQPGLVRAFERAERWMYRSAHSVTTTTAPFCRHIDEVAGRPTSVHLPNGALDELLALPERPPPGNGRFTVGYAGNLGIAQGLDIVLEAAGHLRGAGAHFLIVGDGPRGATLREVAQARGLDNVEFRPSVPADQVGPVLQGCHALLIPLRDHALLDGFIPSKLYDAMAVGRPAIVAARGEAAALVRKHDAGLTIAPEDGAALADAVRALRANPARVAQLGAAGREAAPQYARSHQVARLEAILAEAAASAGRPASTRGR